MFDSTISASDFIAEVKSEVDVALPITDASYVTWLNSLEQFLYSSIIHEQHRIIAPPPYTGTVYLSNLPIGGNEAAIRFDDIYTVYADSTQLIKTNAASGRVFEDCYYKYNNDMAYSLAKTPNTLSIVYYIKPALKKIVNGNITGGNVMLPIEFIELAKSKLRAEAYMVENEYTPAANWMNNYNVLLENFKQWLNERAAQFGM